MPIAARESGVGEAAVAGADAAARTWPRHERAGHDARVGRLVGGDQRRAASRRPLASSTAWPTWAAKPMATSDARRREEGRGEDFERHQRVPACAAQATAAPPGGGRTVADGDARGSAP